jgi:hypothetical protein
MVEGVKTSKDCQKLDENFALPCTDVSHTQITDEHISLPERC